MTTTTATVTVSPTERPLPLSHCCRQTMSRPATGEGSWSCDNCGGWTMSNTHDLATVTGPKGSTTCKGCLGVSASGRYRVTTTWKHGRALLGSSTVVEADSGIAASIKVAAAAEGGYVTCDAGTVEAS